MQRKFPHFTAFCDTRRSTGDEGTDGLDASPRGAALYTRDATRTVIRASLSQTVDKFHTRAFIAARRLHKSQSFTLSH